MSNHPEILNITISNIIIDNATYYLVFVNFGEPPKKYEQKRSVITSNNRDDQFKPTYYKVHNDYMIQSDLTFWWGACPMGPLNWTRNQICWRHTPEDGFTSGCGNPAAIEERLPPTITLDMFNRGVGRFIADYFRENP